MEVNYSNVQMIEFAYRNNILEGMFNLHAKDLLSLILADSIEIMHRDL